MSEGPPRVAVIGSGLAGLTASWLLTRPAEEGGDAAPPPARVELYESAPSLGMGTHSVEMPAVGAAQKKVFVDIPPRFVVPSYYTELLALYETIGIPFYQSSGDGCCQDLRAKADAGGAALQPYFRFGNVRAFGLSLPYVALGRWSGMVQLRIIRDLLRFRWRARTQLSSGSLTGMTFGEYLDANYSADFADRYAVPVLCVVCTCSPAAVRAYPADTLVEYWLCWALRGEGLRRADGGTKEVVERLSAGLSACHLATRVTALRGGRNGDPWLVKDDKGNTREFDHVILATQAKHAAELLAEYREAEDGAAADARLRRLGEAVGAVRSEAGEMVLCVTSIPANRIRIRVTLRKWVADCVVRLSAGTATSRRCLSSVAAGRP